MKLYRVFLIGMKNTVHGTNYGSPYVVANDPTSAYTKVKKYLDKNDLGFVHERELESVQLLAEEGDYPKCNEQLFLN